MQSAAELRDIITRDRPDLMEEEVNNWIFYLLQLKGCHLYSAVSQSINPEEWLRVRRSGIGGSDIAAVMGESKWKAAHSIWLDKTGLGGDKEYQQSEAARWGNVLETSIADEWARREERQYINIPVQIRSDTYEFMLANIDGFTLTDDRQEITGILEVKTTNEHNRSVWETGPLPFYYICQTNWYMAITGLHIYDIICLVGGQKLYSYQLPLDRDLVDRMITEAKYFWEVNVKQLVEPTLSAADLEEVKAAEHDEELPALILDDDDTEKLVEVYIQLREKMSAIKELKDAVYAQLFGKLGKATQALTQTHSITLKTSNRRSCNFDLLMEQFPEAYDACVSVTSSSSLNIK